LGAEELKLSLTGLEDRVSELKEELCLKVSVKVSAKANIIMNAHYNHRKWKSKGCKHKWRRNVLLLPRLWKR